MIRRVIILLLRVHHHHVHRHTRNYVRQIYISLTVHLPLFSKAIRDMAAIIDPDEDYYTIVAAEEKLAAAEIARKKALEDSQAELKGAHCICISQEYLQTLDHSGKQDIGGCTNIRYTPCIYPFCSSPCRQDQQTRCTANFSFEQSSGARRQDCCNRGCITVSQGRSTQTRNHKHSFRTC